MRRCGTKIMEEAKPRFPSEFLNRLETSFVFRSLTNRFDRNPRARDRQGHVRLKAGISPWSSRTPQKIFLVEKG